MNDRGNSREIERRNETGVLFEPCEPLFPDMVCRKRTRLGYFISFLFFVCLAVTVLIVTMSGKAGDEDYDSGGNMGLITAQESEFGVTGNPSESGGSHGESSEKDTESNKGTETSNIIVDEGVGTDVNGDMSDFDTNSETGVETEFETDLEVIEADLSRVEEGEDLVVNYSDKSPDIAGLIDRGFVYSEIRGSDLPLVMVIHTHTSEKYLGSSSTSVFDSVATVGDELNARLNSFGLSSLHCTVIHDGDGTNAYMNARETIETMLRIYPSIKYIIDIHRLELESDGAIVKTVSGCEDGSAQIRLTVSSSSGDGWQENLSLALALRQRINRDGLRVCMPTVISPSRYNSDLSEFYIMADIGSLGNSVDEAKAAAVRLADAMCTVILKK